MGDSLERDVCGLELDSGLPGLTAFWSVALASRYSRPGEVGADLRGKEEASVSSMRAMKHPGISGCVQRWDGEAEDGEEAR